MAEYKELTLSELNLFVKRLINDEVFSSPLWIIAEISEFKVAKTGHCYLELVEKQDNKIVAKSRATIWNNRCPLLKDYFYEKTGTELKDGIKILFRAEVRFHEVYGFSLNILDIEPSFTIGELAKQKEEVINRLKEEGIFELNKETELPVVIQRIAVISSETAAGYEDFVNTLENNGFGYVFEHKLFPALLQGDEAVNHIVEALNKVYEEYEKFDVVVIIRGGGAKLDMNVFDSYEVASNVAQFPLPVISGIGHTRDVSVLDMVSKAPVKTPTAAAEFIINHNREFEAYLDSLVVRLNNSVQSFFSGKKLYLETVPQRIKSASVRFNSIKTNILLMSAKALSSALESYFETKKFHTQTLKTRLKDAVNIFFVKKEDALKVKHNSLIINSKHLVELNKNKINHLEEKLQNLNPEHLFKRGYHLVANKDGKIITDIDEIKQGDTLNIYFNKGKAETEVKEIKRYSDKKNTKP